MNKNFSPSTAAALVAVLTLAVTGVGWAEGMDKGMDDMSGGKTLSEEERNAFSQLDTNKDGKISQEKFDRADSNHDKVLDVGEFARFETDTEQSK